MKSVVLRSEVKEPKTRHVLMEIRCPRCRGGLRLEDFEITHHVDGTWSADPSIECTHEGCDAAFFITHGMVEYGAGSKL